MGLAARQEKRLISTMSRAERRGPKERPRRAEDSESVIRSALGSPRSHKAISTDRLH